MLRPVIIVILIKQSQANDTDMQKRRSYLKRKLSKKVIDKNLYTLKIGTNSLIYKNRRKILPKYIID